MLESRPLCHHSYIVVLREETRQACSFVGFYVHWNDVIESLTGDIRQTCVKYGTREKEKERKRYREAQRMWMRE